MPALTVGQLRKAMEGLPDDAEVLGPGLAPITYKVRRFWVARFCNVRYLRKTRREAEAVQEERDPILGPSGEPRSIFRALYLSYDDDWIGD